MSQDFLAKLSAVNVDANPSICASHSDKGSEHHSGGRTGSLTANDLTSGYMRLPESPSDARWILDTYRRKV